MRLPYLDTENRGVLIHEQAALTQKVTGCVRVLSHRVASLTARLPEKKSRAGKKRALNYATEGTTKS